jgi:copper chaperone NosL
MRNPWLIMLIATIAACRSEPPKPVDIESWDMCAFCRMAISQKQFAAEIVEASGLIQKFDDIGCLLRYRRRLQAVPAATFVVDRRTRRWLPAEAAYFVHSDRLQTPMGGGFAAFGDPADAESAARDFKSSVVRFSALAPAGGGI